ncbi:hypothetical protein EJB05_47406, partial [Eragrostis curvula]
MVRLSQPYKRRSGLARPKAATRDELVHGYKAGTEEGTSVDNHHAIPRPEYNSWSSPGNMPGNVHDIGSEQTKP